MPIDDDKKLADDPQIGREETEQSRRDFLKGSALAAGAGLAAATVPSASSAAGADNPPENPYWADSGTAVYYEQKRVGGSIRDLQRIELDGGGVKSVSALEATASSNTSAYDPKRTLRRQQYLPTG